MYRVECKNLAKFFGKTEVFRGLKFGFEGAACIGIRGVNGSGKSTLLKCLSGLLRPSEGDITWQRNGEPVGMRSIRYHIGYAAPYIQMYRELSVAENLSFVQRIRPGRDGGKHHDETEFPPGKGKPGPLSEPFRERVSEILDRFELAALSGQEFGSLSSGQQQRVRLAAALVSDPPILMLDEPGTNLDADGIELVTRLIENRRSSGGMVFLASNREEELALCDEHVPLTPAVTASL